MVLLRSGGPLSSSASSQAEADATASSPFDALFRSVPPLFMPSWRGWAAVTALEVAALGASLWLKLTRRPVIVIGSGSGGAAPTVDLLTPPVSILPPPRTADNSSCDANTNAISAASPSASGIDALPMTEEKDHQRAVACVRHLAQAALQDPYFSVVLRAHVMRLVVDGGVSRVPLIGGIIGAQCMMFMLRRDASFLASNF